MLMLPMPIEVRIGFGAEIMQAMARVFEASTALDRSIEISALRALVELDGIARRAREALGLEPSYRVCVRYEFAVVDAEHPAPDERRPEPLTPAQAALARAVPYNELPA